MLETITQVQFHAIKASMLENVAYAVFYGGKDCDLGLNEKLFFCQEHHAKERQRGGWRMGLSERW